jgi:hypothetical protein
MPRVIARHCPTTAPVSLQSIFFVELGESKPAAGKRFPAKSLAPFGTRRAARKGGNFLRRPVVGVHRRHRRRPA